MYLKFYGMKTKPFSLLPDGDVLFLSERHKHALSLLDYGLMTEAGFVVITGEIGAGKTSIVRRFMKSIGPNIKLGLITNPSPSFGRLLAWIAQTFDLETKSGEDASLYQAFTNYLVDEYGAGNRVILVIDEAQNLGAETLEELRMLSNINNEKSMLLQVVLVGQPELLETLKKPTLRQFVQRISVHCHLTPLSPIETADYIRFRLNEAGVTATLFDDTACAIVHLFTGGVPRLINLLCDQALVYGYSEELTTIPYQTIAEVACDRSHFGLSAYLNVPSSWSDRKLLDEIEGALSDIRSATYRRKIQALIETGQTEIA